MGFATEKRGKERYQQCTSNEMTLYFLPFPGVKKCTRRMPPNQYKTARTIRLRQQRSAEFQAANSVKAPWKSLPVDVLLGTEKSLARGCDCALSNSVLMWKINKCRLKWHKRFVRGPSACSPTCQDTVTAKKLGSILTPPRLFADSFALPGSRKDLLLEC